MIKPWILNMNMTKSLKPQKTISNLITRFMFNSGLCEYTPSHQRFNHRWFRGSSIRYIQITQITWITWHSHSFFYFFKIAEKKIRTSNRFGYLVWKQDFYQTAFWNWGWIDFWEKMVLVFYFDILYFSVSELVSTSLVGIWTDLWSFIHVFKHLWRLLKS